MSDKIVSTEEILPKKQCEIYREQCYKTNIKPLMDKLEKLDEKIDKLVINFVELPKKLTDELDKRYADKKTEKTVDKLIWLVLASVIVAILALVLKK